MLPKAALPALVLPGLLVVGVSLGKRRPPPALWVPPPPAAAPTFATGAFAVEREPEASPFPERTEVRRSLSPCVVAGRVVDADGQPASGARVELADDGGEADATADEEGGFEIEAAPGDYLLVAERTGEGEYGAGVPLSLAPGERVDGIVIVLRPGPSVSGVLVGAGEGVAELCAVPIADPAERGFGHRAPVVGDGCIARATSDARHRFEIGPLPPGRVRLLASSEESRGEADVVAGAHRVTLRMVVPPPEPEEAHDAAAEEPATPDAPDADGDDALEDGVDVSGLVRGLGGRPLDGVRVYCAGGGKAVSVDGHFALACPPTTRTLWMLDGMRLRMVPVELAAEERNYLEVHL